MKLSINYSIESEISIIPSGTLRSYLKDNWFYVIDKSVAEQYKDLNLSKVFYCEAGESVKSIETLHKLIDFLKDSGCKRTDTLASIGGGTIGDVSGFVASVYMRGIRWINIPTTLLSMINSSIGGKTAVNYNENKNLIGTFYNPEKVIIDPAFLSSSIKSKVTSGIGEVIKYAFIRNRGLYDILLNNRKQISEGSTELLVKIIKTCTEIKIELVNKDPFEKDKRIILNAGRTFGQAIESYSNYAVPHGDAVACGLLLETKVGEKLGFSKPEVVESIEKILSMYGFKCDINPEKILPFLQIDKKNVDGGIRMPFIADIGKTVIQTVNFDALTKAIKEIQEQ